MFHSLLVFIRCRLCNIFFLNLKIDFNQGKSSLQYQESKISFPGWALNKLKNWQCSWTFQGSAKPCIYTVMVFMFESTVLPTKRAELMHNTRWWNMTIRIRWISILFHLMLSFCCELIFEALNFRRVST